MEKKGKAVSIKQKPYQTRYTGLFGARESCRKFSESTLLHLNILLSTERGLLAPINTNKQIITTNDRINTTKPKFDNMLRQFANAIIVEDEDSSHEISKEDTETEVLNTEIETEDTVDVSGVFAQIPLPVTALLYKQASPIINAVYQDYKKIFGPPEEHFMTLQAKNIRNEIDEFLEIVYL